MYCSKHYENILKSNTNESDIPEWLRLSFLNVDIHIEKEEGQNEIGNMRREEPPARPPLLQILDQNKNPENEGAKTNEELNLDGIGCTANVIYMDHSAKKIYVVNAGDSRCTMGKGGKCVEMSLDHKPES
jgi:hypothetical protein